MSKVRLGDICNISSGGTPSRSKPEYWENGTIPWVKISDFKDKYINATEERITPLALEKSSAKLLHKGCILFSIFATLGEVSILDIDAATNQAIASLELKSDLISKDYLYCFLTSLKSQVSRMGRGVAQNNINLSILKNIEIIVPEKKIQTDITKRLETLDRMITLSNLHLIKLDELVKSRFVEMFGDIKLNPYKWDIVPFSKLTDIITDGEHATPKRVTKGIYLLSARNVLNHELQLFDVDYISEEEYRRISKRIIPRNGDVLLSCSGSVGRCCVVPNNIKFQMVRSVALLRFKNTINPVFAEYLITSDFIQDQINSNKTASSQANLFQGKIAKLNGINPPQQLQNQFADFVTKIDQQKATVQKSIEKLETLKKSLMQEYFG